MSLNGSLQRVASRGVQQGGVTVTISRESGFAPNVTTVSATITALVQNVQVDANAQSDTGLSSSQPGSISQDDRVLKFMAADLDAQGFASPVAKGDVVQLPSTSELLIVSRVDAYKFAMAGVVEIYVTGVQ